jgi:hypothetical protein
MQVYQSRKLDKARKELDHVINTLSIILFGVKQKIDEQKEKGTENQN